MENSSTYKALLAKGEAKGRAEGREEGRAEGRANEARELILRLGGRRFGPPDAQAIAQISQTRDSVQLNAWADRLLEVENWNELLA